MFIKTLKINENETSPSFHFDKSQETDLKSVKCAERIYSKSSAVQIQATTFRTGFNFERDNTYYLSAYSRTDFLCSVFLAFWPAFVLLSSTICMFLWLSSINFHLTVISTNAPKVSVVAKYVRRGPVKLVYCFPKDKALSSGMWYWKDKSNFRTSTLYFLLFPLKMMVSQLTVSVLQPLSGHMYCRNKSCRKNPGQSTRHEVIHAHSACITSFSVIQDKCNLFCKLQNPILAILL